VITKRIEIVDSGVLYANPFPADWAINAYYSRIIEIRPGELLCVYRRAQAMYGNDGRSWLLRSTDGGKTWIDEGCLWDGSQDERSYSYAATNLTRMTDGQIVILGHRFYRPKPDMPMYNAATGGHLPEQAVLFRSRDDGHTWSKPQVIEKPDDHLILYDSITELDGGRWFTTCDWDNEYDDPTPLPSHVSALFSDDGGVTWGDRVQLTGGPREDIGFWHTRVTKLADGRLVGFPWAGANDGTEFHTLHRIEGTPDGLSWSEPKATTLRAQTNRPADMEDGYLALVMSVRESEQPGIYVALSDDEGYTWDTDNWVQVWDAYGQDSIGAPRTATYPAGHDTIAFGAPDVIRLSDGDLMASFWAGQQGQMVVRWCRLKMR
jgi:hypothetical protein